jgi:8-oxo-dGTP pyrophosphatase MutT (NUDIX family)
VHPDDTLSPPLARPNPPIASDGLQFLSGSARQCIALEDHLRREVASSQALVEQVRQQQARIAELEALCKYLGVVPIFTPGIEPTFEPLAEVRKAMDLPDPHLPILPPREMLVGDHVRNSSGVRMCAAAMVLRRASRDTELEVLLLQRAPTAPYGAGAWTMPAGGVTPADGSIIAAANRELQEETGLVFEMETLPQVSDALVSQRGRVVRIVDGLTPKTGGFPFACAVVLGNVADAEAFKNREPDIHSMHGWFTVATLPADTWDRAMIVEIMGREEDAFWSTDEHGNPSITQQIGGAQ